MMQDVTEGTRRRNKATGEVQVMRGGQWVSEGGAPATPGVILGPPERRKDPPSGYVETGDGLTPIRGGPADPYRPGGELDPNKPGKDEKATEGAKTAAGYYARMVAAQKAYGDGIAPRSVTGQVLADIAPRSVVNSLSSPERRAAQNLADEFIRAKLRRESGAVIGAEEMEREYELYFPMPGDTDADLTRKAKLRDQAIQSMRAQAGGEADKVEIIDLPGPGHSTTGEGRFGDQPSEKPNGFRMSDEQTAQWQGWLAANREGLTPDKMAVAYQAITGQGLDAQHSQEVIGYLNKGGDPAKIGVDYSKLDAQIEEQVRAEADKLGPAGAQDLIVQGATLGLSDEAAGVGRAIAATLAGGSPAEGYRLGRDAERLRLSDARDRMGWGGTALEIGGGFLSANPETIIRPALSALGTIREGAKTGAIGGALAGYGYGEGLEGSAKSAIAGAAAGGVLGGTISGASTRLANQGIDAELASAAQAEGVRVSQPMYAGQRAINKAGTLEADPVTAPIIQDGFANTGEDIGRGVSRLGQGGEAMEPGPAGDMVREAAKRIKKADKEASDAAYAAAEAVDGDPMIDPVAMRGKIDREIARLERTPGTNQDAIRQLRRYRADIEKPVPLSALRDMRTAIRSNVNGTDLTRTAGQKAADRRMLSVIEGTKDDIKAGLSEEAFTKWAEADANYAANMAYMKDAIIPFVGKDFDQLPAEKIFDRLKIAANKDGRALAALHRRLNPDESRALAATFAEGLGKRAPEDPFSPALFISQARKIGPSQRQTLFGPSGSASFDNLLRLSRRLERAKGEVNRSKTARPVISAVRQKMGQLMPLLLGGGGLAAGGPVGGGIGAGIGVAAGLTGAVRRTLSAKALMNPRVSKLLAEGVDINTDAQAANWMKRLSDVAAREPALAGELGQVQDFFSRALQASPGKAAATGDEDQ